MNLKNATCEFAFLAGERLMDLDTIVTAGLFEEGQFDYCSGAAEALGVTPELSPGDAAELVALTENTAVAAVDDQAMST